MNIVTRSRKNSVESFRFNNDKDIFKKYEGLNEAKLSFDMNDLIAKNLFEDDNAIKL